MNNLSTDNKNHCPLYRHCRWPSARSAIALIGTLAPWQRGWQTKPLVVLLLLAMLMTACKSRQTASVSHYHSDTAYHYRRDAASHVSATTHDTISVMKTETLWREPDSLGNIYPLLTTATETTAKRQMASNIVTTRADTLSVTDVTDHTETAETRQDTSLHARQDNAVETRHVTSLLPWLLLLLLVIVLWLRTKVKGQRTKD